MTTSTSKAAKVRRTREPAPAVPEVGRARILVVEDELDLQDLLRYNLEREGYSVASATRGEEALKAIRQERPDMVLLDLMLPGMDGLEVCRSLRSDAAMKDLPIVMLTAKGEEADVVAGLELGADDYITKPFSPRVLIARLKAVMRRRGKIEEKPDEDQPVRVGPLTVDPQRYEVRVNDEPVNLTRTEFGIVQLLTRRPGRVFTRSQIVSEVQGANVAVTDRSVDVHIVSLRRKLGDAGRLIETVRGVGYRLEQA
jgi:two-component system alkaline phosphatase synthesis response regulator PhoP